MAALQEPTRHAARRRDVLTRREHTCLVLTGLGHSEKQIAQKLHISPNTVRVHIENIKRKLGAANKSHALVLALIAGEAELSNFENGEASFRALSNGENAAPHAAHKN